jgi:Tfp pilus assembly PilM family ATPase
VVADGEVIEPSAVAIAIKDLWRRTRISSRRVIIGVANQRVVVRLVDVPWMQPNELRSSLAFQAQKEMLAGHLQAVRLAGLRPDGIDLNPIALLRSLGRWPGSARAPTPWSTWARGSPAWWSTRTGCCASCASCSWAARTSPRPWSG